MQNFTETLVTLIHPTYGCDFPTAGNRSDSLWFPAVPSGDKGDFCAKQIAREKNRGGLRCLIFFL